MARTPLSIPVARADDDDLALLAALANRHGLVAGATGTGKTITLRVMAEGFSRLGVPVFMADVKGDLSGLARPGVDAPPIADRVRRLRLEQFGYEAVPVEFWDVFGRQGNPVRATVTEMGPLLLARILGLNDVQEGVLQLAFKVADDNGLLLLDSKDLRAIVQHVSDHAAQIRGQYGNVSAASVGAIQRGLLAFEAQGGDKLLGEPALDLEDLMQVGPNGRGVVNILAADELIRSPQVYATLLLWMLAELFERLPEVGDPEKPRLVFFFDEAHLLFEDAPKPLLDRIEQVVRLVRSKGVGVYFVTQNPLDVPDVVLGQLGNRVQHALRAFTPRDQKAVKAAAETFRKNPQLDTETAITELGVGEALVSFLDEKGTPAPVRRALVYPPRTRLQPLTTEERSAIVGASPLGAHYRQVVDRESAYEKLKGGATQAPAPTSTASTPSTGSAGGWGWSLPHPSPETSKVLVSVAQSAARAAGTQIGREVIRGVLGSIFGGTRRRR